MPTQKDIKFGTDGWRAVIAWDFTFPRVRSLSQALADFIISEITASRSKTPYAVAVGYDSRFLSDRTAGEIARILNSNKIKAVLSTNPVTTPTISLLTKKNFNLGVMVTASHNPFYYNGIKIKTNGHSAGKDLTDKIEALIGKHSPLVDHNLIIKAKDFKPGYIKYVKSKFNLKAINSQIKKPVVLDYMFGVQTRVFENFVSPKKIIALNSAEDPLFGNTSPEPIESNLTNLASTVTKNKALVGFAFDGDGDRISVIDEKGNYINPSQLFGVIVKYLTEVEKLKGKIVQTVSMGYMAKRIARKKGFEFEEVPVGFKYVSEKIDSQDILAGGEESGGYAWKGVLPERDGVTAALMVLEIITKTGKKMSELVSEIEDEYGRSVFVRKDFTLAREISDMAVFVKRLLRKIPKRVALHKVAEVLEIDGLKVTLENDFWFLLRPSGTENCIRIYAESDNKKSTDDLINYAAKLIARFLK
jgi:phosphomannomutase